jgi:F-type H+-transporting ATPase subunit alpha
MEDIPLEQCGPFEEGLLRYVNTTHPDIVRSIGESRDLNDELEAQLTEAINNFKPTFV